MKLKKLSLQSNTKNTSNKFVGSIEIDEQNAPILHLVNPENNDEINLSFIYNTDNKNVCSKTIYCGSYEDNSLGFWTERISQGNLFYDIASIKLAYNKDKDYLETLQNIVILGHICDSVCNSEASIFDVVYNDLFNEFIKTSMDYYKTKVDNNYNYTFDFNKLKNLIPIKEMNCKDIQGDIKKYLLPGESLNTGILCKGIIGYNYEYIYLQYAKDNIFAIKYSSILKHSESDNLRKIILKSLFWFLVSFNNFFVNDSQFFFTNEIDFKFDLPYEEIYNACFIDPTNTFNYF